MPDSKDKNRGERDDDGMTHVPADEPRGSDHPGGDRDAPVLDPTNPASKPYGTTRDQVANMEGEGQAQTPGQEPPAGINEKS